MMRLAVTVCLVPEATRGPFVYHARDPDTLGEALREAKGLGYDSIEVFPGDPEELNRFGLAGRLAETGLRVAAVGSGAGLLRHGLTLTDANPSTRERAEDYISRMIDAAASFNAPVIIGSMQGRAGSPDNLDTARALLASALARLARRAADEGELVLFEPLNRYESDLANTLESASGIIAESGAANLRLLADLFHMNIEEKDSAAALTQAGASVGHVHFADSNRHAAGGGHTDFGPVFAALKAENYSGYLSAEVFPRPDAHAAATATINAFRTLSKV